MVTKRATMFSRSLQAWFVRPISDPKDVFARYGGEEFVTLLSNTNAEEATKLAENIRAAIESHAFIYEGKRLPITTSLGVAELTADIESAHTLIKQADKVPLRREVRRAK